MAAHSSLSQELIKAINMPNIRPTPAYLSEEDAVTVDMFMQSEYASDYMIDTRNIHWGGEVHHSHIFDIYAKFSPTKARNDKICDCKLSEVQLGCPLVPNNARSKPGVMGAKNDVLGERCRCPGNLFLK